MKFLHFDHSTGVYSLLFSLEYGLLWCEIICCCCFYFFFFFFFLFFLGGAACDTISVFSWLEDCFPLYVCLWHWHWISFRVCSEMWSWVVQGEAGRSVLDNNSDFDPVSQTWSWVLTCEKSVMYVCDVSSSVGIIILGGHMWRLLCVTDTEFDLVRRKHGLRWPLKLHYGTSCACWIWIHPHALFPFFLSSCIHVLVSFFLSHLFLECVKWSGLHVLVSFSLWFLKMKLFSFVLL